MSQTLVSAAEMRELDRRTIEELGVPARTLMEVAGRAVAEAAQAVLPRRGVVTLVCGVGNNGGDGFVAARALVERGHDVRVFVVGALSKLRDPAQQAYTTLERQGGANVLPLEVDGQLKVLERALEASDLTIDALFGTGFVGAPRGLTAEVMTVVNRAARHVLAVDVPSGVNSDTGAVAGEAVRAHKTVAFAFPKRGHVLHPGASLTGELTVVDIGIPAGLAAGHAGVLLTQSDIPELAAARSLDVNKGTFGTLAVLAGSVSAPGAAILALRGALRSGVGLVRWATDRATVALAPTLPPEAMLTLRDEAGARFAEEALTNATALCVGPGYTLARAQELRAVLTQAKVPLCLDADALNLLAQDASLWEVVTAPAVLTPHPKEMARLIGGSVEDVQRDRIGVALGLAAERRCVVVLKGAGTVIAEPDGAFAVARVGNPGMATGGTGDVLAGLIGGLLAQGLAPGQAARLGVLVHGAAGDLAKRRFGEAGLAAGDVAEAIGAVWAEAAR